MMKKISVVFFLILICGFAISIVFGFLPYEKSQAEEIVSSKNERPNVVIIMADDLNLSLIHI